MYTTSTFSVRHKPKVQYVYTQHQVHVVFRKHSIPRECWDSTRGIGLGTRTKK